MVLCNVVFLYLIRELEFFFHSFRLIFLFHSVCREPFYETKLAFFETKLTIFETLKKKLRKIIIKILKKYTIISDIKLVNILVTVNSVIYLYFI